MSSSSLRRQQAVGVSGDHQLFVGSCHPDHDMKLRHDAQADRADFIPLLRLRIGPGLASRAVYGNWWNEFSSIFFRQCPFR